jgi:hypothetical protein
MRLLEELKGLNLSIVIILLIFLIIFYLYVAQLDLQIMEEVNVKNKINEDNNSEEDELKLKIIKTIREVKAKNRILYGNSTLLAMRNGFLVGAISGFITASPERAIINAFIWSLINGSFKGIEYFLYDSKILKGY